MRHTAILMLATFTVLAGCSGASTDPPGRPETPTEAALRKGEPPGEVHDFTGPIRAAANDVSASAREVHEAAALLVGEGSPETMEGPDGIEANADEREATVDTLERLMDDTVAHNKMVAAAIKPQNTGAGKTLTDSTNGAANGGNKGAASGKGDGESANTGGGSDGAKTNPFAQQLGKLVQLAGSDKAHAAHIAEQTDADPKKTDAARATLISALKAKLANLDEKTAALDGLLGSELAKKWDRYFQ